MTELTATRIVRPVRRGQITIPIEFRRQLGIEDDTLLRITLHEGRLEITPVVDSPKQGSAWLRDLYDFFEPARKDLEALSEEEVDTLIDEAVAEVRAEQNVARRS